MKTRIKKLILTTAIMFVAAFVLGSGTAPAVGHPFVARTSSLHADPIPAKSPVPIIQTEYVYVSAPAPSTPASGSSSGHGSCHTGNPKVDIPCCESGGSYTAQNPSGAGGKYQYMPGTWNGYGGYSRAQDAPPSVQDQRFQQDTSGGNYNPWNASRGCWG